MTANELLEQMTLEEKCSMLSGETFYYTQEIGRLGIPGMMFTDGPHGLRKQDDKEDHLGLNESVPATCFPAGCALASSWDRELMETVAQALGAECRAEHVAVLLGPAMNIKRSPLCGRNFEYYSEDPYLASHLAKHYIQGLQSMGVGACVKHFAVNNQETKRLTLNAVVDERTLREIYLPCFETAVREGRPWTVMSAYNQLNGHFGSENAYLLDEILRREWGFDGVVVTDWGGTNERVDGLIAGQDLEMPTSGTVNDDKVLSAVRDGSLPEAYVDQAVLRLLKLMEKHLGAKETPLPDQGRHTAAEQETQSSDPEHQSMPAFDKERHHQLAKEAAKRSMVLLKNDDHLLPLRKEESIAVIGEFAVSSRYQGGGSSHINPTKVDCLLEEMIRIAGKNVRYAKGFAQAQEDEDEELTAEALRLAGAADKVVVCAGLPETYETEGLDRTHLRTPGAQEKLIRRLAQVNPNLIVVLYNGAPVELPYENQAGSILEAYLPGQAGGSAAAELLYGIGNPSGKLAETFPKRLQDTPCYLSFPGEGYTAQYQEGIFVGYRYYDTKELKPMFCFGHGLSYTTFEYADLQISRREITDRDTLTVSVSITNIGDRKGSEIVQLYVHDRQRDVIRPLKELKGFCRLDLEAGETKQAVFTLDYRSFAYYDTEQKDYLVQTGMFDLLIGASSEDIRLSGSVHVQSTVRKHKVFHRNSAFGEVYFHEPTHEKGAELIEYFKRESGIDFDLGERAPDFAFRVICDFPLKALVSFTKGRYSEAMLKDLLEELNAAGA